MKNINIVMLTGYLTRDGELKSLNNGTNILSLSVAVNDSRKNDKGEYEDVPNYIDCTMFGKRAEGVAKYMTKGIKVAIKGHLYWSSWDDNGTKRSKLNVTVDELEFMSRAGKKQDAPTQQASQPQPSAYAQEDIPF